MKNKATGAVMVGIMALTLGACTEADTASYNLSQEADYFGVQRRAVFINGITDEYLLMIEGACSIKADGMDRQLEVTCKTGESVYKKHYLGLSDNVSYLVEQLEGKDVPPHHYKVVFRPTTIVPDIDIK